MARTFARVFLCLLLSTFMVLPTRVSFAKDQKKPATSTQKKPRTSSATKGGKKSASKAETKPKPKSGSTSNTKKRAVKSAPTSRRVAGSPKKVVIKKPVSSKSTKKKSGGNVRTAAPIQKKTGKKKSVSSETAAKSAVPETRAIRLKQSELDRIRKEIRDYENRLAESKRTERGTLERIDMYDRQTELIRQVVSHLKGEIDDKRRDIHTASLTLDQEEKRLRGVKAVYARSIVSAYKRGHMHDTELLLSSTSLNQMLIRSRYLRAFMARQRRTAGEIRERQEAITAQKLLLEEKLNEQRKRVTEKSTQEQTLQRKVVEHKSLLDKVREDKAAYAAELKRRQAAAAKIERLIADLIEREQSRRLAASRKSGGAASKNSRASSASSSSGLSALPTRALSETAFGRLKGRLPWPLAQGRVIGSFGEQVNPKHGTVTISNGIDIATEAGSSVRVVADGTVSMIYFIAGYGNLVIINHDDGFFTVYAHLASIGVREGQRVKAGQTIARSGEGAGGPQIHFEIWRQKNKQNPMNWLAGR